MLIFCFSGQQMWLGSAAFPNLTFMGDNSNVRFQSLYSTLQLCQSPVSLYPGHWSICQFSSHHHWHANQQQNQASLISPELSDFWDISLVLTRNLESAYPALLCSITHFYDWFCTLVQVEVRQRERERETIGACLACPVRAAALSNREEGCLLSPVGSYSPCGFWQLLLTLCHRTSWWLGCQRRRKEKKIPRGFPYFLQVSGVPFSDPQARASRLLLSVYVTVLQLW